MGYRYEKEIKHAVQNAPLLEVATVADLPHTPNQYEWLSGEPDHTAITIRSDRKSLEIAPNQIVVATPAELKRVYAEMLEITNTNPPDDETIGYKSKHESQHGYVAQKIGAKVRYLLTLWREEDAEAYVYQVGMQLSGGKISKIGLAAITAYPEIPSEGDIRDIIAMGYKAGVQEVGRGVKAHNANAGPSRAIPLPLSYVEPGK